MPPAVTVHQGALQLDDRAANFHPDSWRRRIYEILPIDNFPITGITDAMGDEETDSHHFHWPMQPFNSLSGETVDVYTDTPGGTAYSSAGADGDIVVVTLAEADAKKFLVDDVVTFSDTTNYNHVSALVKNVDQGANPHIIVRLLEADNAGTPVLAQATPAFTITGRSEDEISELPEAIYEEAVWYDNYTQRMMGSAELSNREIAERERVDPHIRTRAKLQALNQLNKKREYMRIFGIQKKIGNKTFSGGFRYLINANEPNNMINWKTDTTFSTSGETWNQGAYTFFRDLSEYLSRYSEPGSSKFCPTSGYVINKVSEVVINSGHYNVSETTNSYGLTVTRIKGMNQVWDLYQHPLFTVNPALQYSMMVTELPLWKTKTLRENGLKFIPATSRAQSKNQDGYQYQSGEKCGWEVDEGVCMDNIYAHAWLDGLGVDK